MKAKQTLFSIALIIALLSVSFASCESDKNSEPEDNTPENTENSYLLSSTTKSSAQLTTDKGEDGYSRIYRIKNASDFKLFVEKVNNGDFEVSGEHSGEKTKFILEHDLEISDDYDWIPVGNDTHPFTCTLDGNSHTISGTLTSKYFRSESKSLGKQNINFGFFGMFSGTLQNITFDINIKFTPDAYISNLKIGTLGHLSGGFIDNVHTKGKLEYHVSSETSELSFGGFAYYMAFCEVKNCTSDVSIDINGGPTESGNLLRTINLYVAGVTPVICESNITSFENKGDINITNCELNGQLYAGALAAANEYMRKPTLLEFTNKGKINVSNISTRNHDSPVSAAVGGLIGYGEINSRSGKVINEGDISVHIDSKEIFTYVGGLFGYCMDECIGLTNSGKIRNHSAAGYTGGCVGYMTSFDLKHMYNTGSVESTCEIPAEVEDYPYNYGATGGIVGRIVGGKIHESSNSGNITSAAPYTLYDVECSYAGAICGIGDHPRSCNNNYGTVNSNQTTAANHEGLTWYANIAMQDGKLGDDHPYWKIFWRDIITECWEQFSCTH